MTITTSAPIKQALVAALRANNALPGIYEGFAAQKTDYPFLVYNLVAAPYDFAWGSLMIVALVDVHAFAVNSVEANNLDALVTTTLHGQPLTVTGQSTLLMHRVGDFSSPDVDGEGKKIYQVGGSYEIWTDQPA